MDSLTHLVAGAALAALAAPAGRRRAALLVGAIAGSLPDVDNLWLAFADPVSRFVDHRGFTHSLVLFPLYAVLASLLPYAAWKPAREAPWRWSAAVSLALLSHPLLDAMTVYGTRLFWPIDTTPVMGSNLFIIDPALTLPLVLGVAIAFFAREKPKAQAWLALTLSVSAAYVGWTLVAKHHVESAVRAHFAQQSSEPLEMLTVPTPFNTLAWRVLVLSKEGYFEGYYSFLRDGTFRLDHYPGPRELPDTPAAKRLREFTRDFYRVDRRDGAPVFVDLRMGAEPDYIFRYALREDGTVEPLPLERERLERMWSRFAPMIFERAATPSG